MPVIRMDEKVLEGRRQQKAATILRVLRRFRYTHERVIAMDKKEWAVVAEAAGVGAAGNRTREIILEALLEDEYRNGKANG